MLTIKYHSKLKKDLKKVKSRGLNVEKIRHTIELLANNQSLPYEYTERYLAT